MTIFRYTLVRLFRSKVNLLMVLVFPPLFIGMVFGLGNFGSTDIVVGLVDNDNTPLTEMLAESLADTSPLVTLEEKDVRAALASNKADYILVVDQGFSSQIIEGADPRLRSYSIQETNIAGRVRIKVEGFLGAAKSLAAASGGSSAEFYRGMDSYRDGSFSVNRESLQTQGRRIDSALGGIGLLAMQMLLLSTFTTINLIKDRENKTFYRILASPVSLKQYMIQNIFSFLLILLIQVAVVFLVVHFVFGIYLGASVLNLYLIMAIFALLCVSMGVALSALARTTQQAGTAASLIVTPMCMLSGLFWPRSMMPDILQTIGNFLPTTWVVEAAHKVMLGYSLTETYMELAIILGFTLVFFLLGTWRRADVAK